MDLKKFQNISPVLSARAMAELQNLTHKLRVQFSDQLFKRRIRETRFVAHVIVQYSTSSLLGSPLGLPLCFIMVSESSLSIHLYSLKSLHGIRSGLPVILTTEHAFINILLEFTLQYKMDEFNME